MVVGPSPQTLDSWQIDIVDVGILCIVEGQLCFMFTRVSFECESIRRYCRHLEAIEGGVGFLAEISLALPLEMLFYLSFFILQEEPVADCVSCL